MHCINLVPDLISAATGPYCQEFDKACASKGGGWRWRSYEVSGHFFSCQLLANVFAATGYQEELEFMHEQSKSQANKEYRVDDEFLSRGPEFLWEVVLRNYALLGKGLAESREGVSDRFQGLWWNPVSDQLRELMADDLYRESANRALKQSLKKLYGYKILTKMAHDRVMERKLEWPKHVRQFFAIVPAKDFQNDKLANEFYSMFVKSLNWWNVNKETGGGYDLRALLAKYGIDEQEPVHEVLGRRIKELEGKTFAEQLGIIQQDEKGDYKYMLRQIRHKALDVVRRETSRAWTLGMLQGDGNKENLSGKLVEIISLDRRVSEAEDSLGLLEVIPNPSAGDPSDVLELFPEQMISELEDIVGGKRWLRPIVRAFQEIMGPRWHSAWFQATRGEFDEITQLEVAEHIGKPSSTVNDWFRKIRSQSAEIVSIYMKYYMA